jgi:hypothetical protein
MPFDSKQIAALENAIEGKYGEEAVLDPSSIWTPEKESVYLEQVRKVEKYYRQLPYETLKDCGGFILKERLINKSGFKNCSYCGEPALKTHDDVYMTKFKSCLKCYILHIEGKVKNGRNS